QSPLALVASQRCRAFELGARLLVAAELDQEIAAHARQQMVVLECRLLADRIDEAQARFRAERERERYRAVEIDDRGGRELSKRAVKPDDPEPVGLVCRARPRMAGGNRGLQGVGAKRRPTGARRRLGVIQRSEAAADEQLIPARTVLLEQQHRLAG